MDSPSISKSGSNLILDKYGLQEVLVEDNLVFPPSCAADGDNSGAAYTNPEGQARQAGGRACGDEILVKKLLNSAINTGLYHNALSGDWKRAQSTLDKDPQRKITDPITRDNENILHIAAATKHGDFVKWAIDRMTTADMARLNKHGNTALSFAATSGTVKVATLIVQKNEHVPVVRGSPENVTPLFIAISFKRQEMASYLFSVTDFKQLTPDDQIQILIATIYSDFYGEYLQHSPPRCGHIGKCHLELNLRFRPQILDPIQDDIFRYGRILRGDVGDAHLVAIVPHWEDIGLKILKENPKLAIQKNTKHNNETALHVLARKPLAFGSRHHKYIWRNWFNSCIKGICNQDMEKTARQLVSTLWDNLQHYLPEKEMLEFIKHPTILMHDAARAGNVEFLIMLIGSYPDIVWEEDDDGKSIFHVAVENRLENVFNLIHEISGPRDFSTRFKTTAKGKYNMLHLAAKLPASNHLNRVSGAALQMQRELLWFNEVEKIALPCQREAKCDDGSVKLTPRELFTKEHKELCKCGEDWMKNTANSCMVVAALIATVVFTAAFTVPGGNGTEGHPMFRKKNWFAIFVISDAVALVSSSTSILIFLSILTSRYAEVDFLMSLPSRLLFGLVLLFVSIVCMVVAFTATFFLLYQRAAIWVPATIGAMAIIPVSSFWALQFKLWVDTFHNTYMSRFIFKSRPRKFFAPFQNEVGDSLADQKY